MIAALLAALRRNVGFKLLSLGIAVLLYLVASFQRVPQTGGRVFLQPEVVGLPEGLANRTGPKGITVTLTGPAELLDETKEKIRVSIDGSLARPGTLYLPVRYQLPPDLAGLVQIEGPTTAEVAIEAKVERLMQIQVLYDRGSALPGTEFRNPVVKPARATVIGLGGDVTRVAQVVALLDNADTAGAVDREVPLSALDEKQQAIPSVQLRPDRVKVMLSLRKVPATKTLVVSATLTGSPAPGHQLIGYRFEPPLVTVRGEPGTLAALSSLRVPVDISGIASSQTRTVALPEPPGIVLDKAQTVAFIVEVRPFAAPTPLPSPSAKGDNP